MARPLRYEAVVVNGEAADGSDFKIVADYIHLNPVRSGWVGGESGKRLRSWRRRSFGAYAGYLEVRAKDRKGVVSDAALAELRSGWFLGEKSFGEKVLESIKAPFAPERKRGSIGGDAAKAHDESMAERLVTRALGELGLPDDEGALTGRGKWKEEKELVAALVRKRTAMANRWMVKRLGMGQEVSVTRAVRRFRDDPKSLKRLNGLEKKVGNP